MSRGQTALAARDGGGSLIVAAVPLLVVWHVYAFGRHEPWWCFQLLRKLVRHLVSCLVTRALHKWISVSAVVPPYASSQGIWYICRWHYARMQS